MWPWQLSSYKVVLLYNPNEPSFYSGRWNTGTNPDLAFTSVGPDSRLPRRRVLERLPRSQHHLGFSCLSRESLLTDGTSARPIGPTIVYHHLIQPMWISLTRTFATSSAKQPRNQSHAVVVTSTYRVRMPSVKTSTKRFCSLLMKISQAGLPHPYYLGLTRSAEIDGLRLFSTSNSHTRAEKHEV